MTSTTSAVDNHWGPLLALIAFTLISLSLGVVAKFATTRRKGFLTKYFLGNRSLGAIAMALTAAVMSGGTFMGFPSLIYSFGWVMALWIASYMVAPLTVMGVLGKRIGQLSRKTGAITLPDLFRERFGSPRLGLFTSLFIMFFLTCNLIPQFRAGGLIMKNVLPDQTVNWAITEDTPAELDMGYMIGLAIFAVTVIAYTTYGGFLAAIWTDVFQSLVMALGVIILIPLALAAAGGLGQATISGVEQTGAGFAYAPGVGYPFHFFHPIGLAFSFFFMWAISGMGQPSTMVRMMAFRDSRTLRYSMIYVMIYNMIIYIPLICIFIAARSILPNLETSDEVMPRLVRHLAHPSIAGIILAAPYGAVMSTVSGFLLIVASGLVRDVYQRFLRPSAPEKEIEWVSYFSTMAVGALVVLIALNPPEFLQMVIIFSSAGMASAFLIPGAMACFWRRATAQGALAAMIVGAGSVILLYGLGVILINQGYEQGIGPANEKFRPYYLLGLDPCVWGLSLSLLTGIVVSLLTPKPDPARVAVLFDAQPDDAPVPAVLEHHPELREKVLDDDPNASGSPNPGSGNGNDNTGSNPPKNDPSNENPGEVKEA